MSQFAHLHLHSQYSLLDGVNKIPDVLQQAAEMGQPAIALTDHGNMHGAVEFYDAAKKADIKPILGCELYMTAGSRHDRVAVSQGGKPTHHLTVLAKNLEGYKNLCRLVTLGYREGFYRKPRVDHELLEACSEGLIVLSGCLASEFSHYVRQDDYAKARECAEWYARVFKDNYYLEVQPHQIEEQQKLNAACADIAKDLGLPLLATTDCHYPTADHHHAQEVLMCISTGKRITDPDRIQHEGVHLHLKTYHEMIEEFGDQSWAEEAVSNTTRIADACGLTFDFSNYFMPLFDSDPGKTLDETFADVALEGLKKRIATFEKQDWWTPEKEKEYYERLEEERELIIQMGFPGYFLVVADFINWAKEHGIPVGPGRGSAAGSLIAYAMRITDVNPIENKLLFERFLNPERVSLPDIDVDFCIYGRDKVIQYVVEKYGKENVAQIATFGTLKAKAAIKDVGRALGMSYAETDRVAQLIPAPRQGFDYSIPEALEMEKRLKEYAEDEGEELIELAMKLEGLTRHTSTHAAGVVIGDRPLIEMLPLMVDKDGNDVTQFSMKYVEKIGLVKFDFLGLKTLTVINTALEIIRGSQGVEIDLETLTLDDPKPYDMLCAGNATGVFQLEGTGITEMTMRLKPNCFDDLVAILALYRPGPLDAGMVDHYIERKHGRQEVEYLHPSMETILKDTYGIILYQEQIMQLARELAGYSLGEADLLRRAMGKKIPEEMAKQRERFLSGAKELNIPDKSAAAIFDQMETFARYGFNRSHSAAYAMISYQTAYLKAHYPVEFMAALMTHEMSDTDKTLKNFTECRKQKIEVLPPNVNQSIASFSVVDGRILYGLSAIKSVGDRAVEVTIAEREEHGPFQDIEDYMERVDLSSVNKRVVENFVRSGAFDFTNVSRRDMYYRVDDLMKAGQALQKERESNQIFMFGEGGEPPSIPRRTSVQPEWPVNQRLAMEREALGFYVSGHPLEKYKGALSSLGALSIRDLRSLKGDQEIRVGGVVTALKLKNTRKGERYANFILEDAEGTVESLVWPNVYDVISETLTLQDPVLVRARPDVTDERCILIVEHMESLIELRDKNARAGKLQGVLQVEQGDAPEDYLERLIETLQAHPGDCSLYSNLALEEYELQIKMPVRIAPSEQLCDEVEQIFGRPALMFVKKESS